jgi:hypothetical protein
MIAILTAFAPFILSILGFGLQKIGASAETKRRFLAMVEGMGQDGLISVNLHKSYEEQRKRLESAELL